MARRKTTTNNDEIKETKSVTKKERKTKKNSSLNSADTMPKDEDQSGETNFISVKETEPEEKPTLTPSEYFNMVKDGIHEETPENIQNLYNVTMKQLKRYMITGQKAAAKNLYAKCLYLEKESKILEKGITEYVLRNDIDRYINEVADKCVCVVEMENFERQIPDDLVDIVADTMDIFDVFFVVFTDYTGEKRSKVAREKREKDPILFGAVLLDGRIGPKLYYIGDWVDDYCDLTLDKIIEEMSKEDDKEIVYDITDYSNLDSIEQELLGTSTRLSSRNKAKEANKGSDE